MMSRGNLGHWSQGKSRLSTEQIFNSMTGVKANAVAEIRQCIRQRLYY